MGPLLLSRMLDLNDVQEGVLNVAFRVADENGRADRYEGSSCAARRDRTRPRQEAGDADEDPLAPIRKAAQGYAMSARPQ